MTAISVTPRIFSGKWAQDLSAETGGVVSNVMTQTFANGVTDSPAQYLSIIACFHFEFTGSILATDIVATYAGLPCQVKIVNDSTSSDQRCLVIVQCIPAISDTFTGADFVLTIGGSPGSIFYFKGWAGLTASVDPSTTLADLVSSNSGATLSPYSQTFPPVVSQAGDMLVSSCIVDEPTVQPLVQSPAMDLVSSITTVNWGAANRVCPGVETNPVIWHAAGAITQQAAYGFSTNIRALTPPCDPDFADVVLLLPADGANGSTTVTDFSNAANPISHSGNAQLSSFDAGPIPPMWGTACMYFPDTSTVSATYFDAPIVAAAPLDILTVASGDFTIEGWFWSTGANSANLLIFAYGDNPAAGGAGVAGLELRAEVNGSNGLFTAFPTISAWSACSSGPITLTAGVWHHFAVVRHGANGLLFLDGVQQGSSATNWNTYPGVPSGSAVIFGWAQSLIGGLCSGAVDEVRVTKGLARYTSNFTPPNAPFGLTCAITVPNVIGDTQAAATTAITGAGLTLGVVSSAFNGAVAAGIVFQQSPSPGSIVGAGAPVNITLSLGAQFATVPDVLEMTAADARSAITAAGLVTGAISGVVDPTTPIGSVATQSPIGGIQVPFGSAVNLGISFLVSEFDVDVTVISQYANSPTILQMVEDFGQWFDPAANIQDFYLTVWNIDTATGFGLDIWGIILGVSRVVPIPGSSGAFGFDNADVPKDWQNFGSLTDPAAGGPFFSGQISTGSYRLSDGPYLTLLLTKALANVCATTAPALNALITNLFPGRGRCYTQDLGGMQMAYHFNFALTSIELAILEFSGVLAHPAGVGVSINIVPESLFGFQEAGALSKPFNFGVFYNGS